MFCRYICICIFNCCISLKWVPTPSFKSIRIGFIGYDSISTLKYYLNSWLTIGRESGVSTGSILLDLEPAVGLVFVFVYACYFVLGSMLRSAICRWCTWEDSTGSWETGWVLQSYCFYFCIKKILGPRLGYINRTHNWQNLTQIAEILVVFQIFVLLVKIIDLHEFCMRGWTILGLLIDLKWIITIWKQTKIVYQRRGSKLL